MVGEKKCLKDYSPGGVITKGQYSATKHDVLTSTILILDSRGHLLYKREGFENGSFSFSTEDYELVDMCFEVKASRLFFLTVHCNRTSKSAPWKCRDFLGHQTGSWGEAFWSGLCLLCSNLLIQLANAENLKPVEAELRRLEAITEEIVTSFMHMHNKSSHMRLTNGRSWLSHSHCCFVRHVIHALYVHIYIYICMYI